MAGKWVEIRGKERGSASVELLFKIPASQWNDETRDIYLQQMNEEGVTDVEIREV